MHTIVDDIPTSVPVQFSLLGSPEIPDFSVNHVCGEVRWTVAECICPQTCDCESEEDGYVSNHCPEHASNSVPCPDCPLCALKYQLYIHGGEFKYRCIPICPHRVAVTPLHSYKTPANYWCYTLAPLTRMVTWVPMGEGRRGAGL